MSHEPRDLMPSIYIALRTTDQLCVIDAFVDAESKGAVLYFLTPCSATLAPRPGHGRSLSIGAASGPHQTAGSDTREQPTTTLQEFHRPFFHPYFKAG